MARVKISEYRAKKILLGDTYRGVLVTSENMPTLVEGVAWVCKVDQGIKKRFTRGLVLLNATPQTVVQAITDWKAQGFSQFLIEPFFPHEQSEERYLSLERVRDGIRIMYARTGGVAVESQPDVQSYVVRAQSDITSVARTIEVPEVFLQGLYETFQKHFFAFLEINPLVVRKDIVHILDAAVLVDSAGEFFVQEAWTASDVVRQRATHMAQVHIEELDATTPASFSLSVLHPDGSLFLMLSAGGGSIVIADEAYVLGMSKEIANYGEYSGGPTRQETYLYAKEILDLLLDSPSPKKALVIAGPVANFTDVHITFLGIVDALEEKKSALQSAGAKVFVRRGGPNETEGLMLMRSFLARENLLGEVHGSDVPLTTAIDEAIAYVRS